MSNEAPESISQLEETLNSLFKKIMTPWLSTSLDAIDDLNANIHDIIEGKIAGITLTDVLTDKQLSRTVLKIKESLHFNTFETYDIIGDDYHLGTADTFEEYLDKAKKRIPAYNDLLGFNPDELLSMVFDKLCQFPKPSEVARFGQKAYKGSVIKAYKENQQFLPHADRLSANLEQYQHLFEIANFDQQLSFVLILQPPIAGGELITYDLSWKDTPPGLRKTNMVSMQLMEQYLRQKHQIENKIDPVAGSLFIFPGGNQWHKVSAIIGEQWRITIGGFMAPDLKGEKLLFWS